ncbi:hypothetical protein AB0L05_19240 [Nonomuraea pusilla]|uniref:hypothetical protein n=1 Tax=Nonomuraea pusilla TaxID=46177 RepID=UPI00332AFCC6
MGRHDGAHGRDADGAAELPGGAVQPGAEPGPLDEALAAPGPARRVVGSVPTFGAALPAVRETDIVGMTPDLLTRGLVEALGLVTFPLPVELPDLTLSQARHPRNDADPARAWLRERVRGVLTRLGDLRDV